MNAVKKVVGKIKGWVGSLTQKLLKGKKGTAMTVAIAYTLLSFFCIVLYIIMTIADWYMTGKGDKPELRLFVTMMLSAGAVGGVLGIGKMLVDKNGDGIPDIMEKGEREDDPRGSPRKGIASEANSGAERREL